MRGEPDRGPHNVPQTNRLTSVEFCAGAGGLALGLEQAGFDPVLLLDNRDVACETLRANRPGWNVLHKDLLRFEPRLELPRHREIDVITAGLPRVKSAATASRTRGSSWELELFETTARLTVELRPRALLIENVPDLLKRDEYESSRTRVAKNLDDAGYNCRWLLVDACDFGVPQHREYAVMVALRDGGVNTFVESLRPIPSAPGLTVGSVLRGSLSARGWPQASEWAAQADGISPTIVGGSWDRGGGDLGPQGSVRAWAKFGVNGRALADDVPSADFVWDPKRGTDHMLKLTVDQVAALQGFPPYWTFEGRKTAKYRQVGNATPPPFAHALGVALRSALSAV
ncbi:DNA cytosine methyltransferase [Nocardia alba]|uniref:DNA (cytosine-5-)-methyltransferase n=1 Tax=Nocardia alba TaxID=225051 RepID=A0A4R1G6B6_9NOCA|nr:DNA cytosine methyltransferase [Nocardia alba]TCJ99291.1 DNA (cytosine-5)-methyltransferase 1 [Nocardia alba]